ncbi:MAG TPA: GIY-YIG nuclease family protein [Candidatus Kryptonia bacterium]
MFYTYIILSLKTGRYYVGSASNLERRVDQHNRGKTTSTRTGIPWKLAYSEEFDSRKKAVERERYIKSQKSKIFIEHLISNASAGHVGQLV